MTVLRADNVHPVGVENCPDGGDDLDLVVAQLFEDDTLKRNTGLSSVNSINWCRVMYQTVHYFYAYFRTVNQVGDPIVFSVPSGAFGNLFAGYLARSMGLPVARFVCANNVNSALHTAFSTGIFPRRDLVQTPRQRSTSSHHTIFGVFVLRHKPRRKTYTAMDEGLLRKPAGGVRSGYS